MNKLPEILSQLSNEDNFYYLLKDRDLVSFNDNIEILQQDNNSTKIKIILPTELNGRTINSNDMFYIDYLKGNGKPGTISNIINIIKVIDKNGVEQTNYSTDVELVNGVLTKKNSSVEIIDNYRYKKSNDIYYVQYSTQAEYERNYETNDIVQNIEESATFSPDYPSGYASSIFNEDYSNKLKVTLDLKQSNTTGNLIKYNLLEWTIDNTITDIVGTVNFSIRIENTSTNFKWQSKINSFRIVSNLKEYYELNKEIEENYIIQNREIKPIGDFKAVLVKGDSNSNKLFYKMNRYYQGQDMLNQLSFVSSDKVYNLYKNSTTIVAAPQDGTKEYYNIIINYFINSIYFNYNGNSYLWKNGVELQLGNKTYTNFTLTQDSQKKYHLKPTIKGGTQETEIVLDNLTDSFELNNTKVNCTFDVNPQSITLSDKIVDTLSNLKPVYNKLIRFVFLSPNKDYGDYNNGQIEYVDTNYFIFSWTPDYRVTRSNGEVSYNIEFYLNSINNLITNEAITAKNYSWSTLSSTIVVEDNIAATATVDYIPNWVSYIENSFQNDFNEFLNNDLTEQFNVLVDRTEKKLGTNLVSVNGTIEDSDETSFTYSFTINSNVYNLIIHKLDAGYACEYNSQNEKMAVIKGTNYIYYNSLKLTDTLYTFIYFNAITNELQVYYEVDAQDDSPVITRFESKVNDAIGNFNKQVYNSPANNSFLNTSETVETQFNNLIKNTNEANKKLQNSLTQQIINNLGVLSFGYSDIAQNLILYNESRLQIPLSYLQTEVIINDAIFNWGILIKEDSNIYLKLTQKESSTTVEAIDNTFQFVIGTSTINAAISNSIITLTTNSSLFTGEIQLNPIGNKYAYKDSQDRFNLEITSSNNNYTINLNYSPVFVKINTDGLDNTTDMTEINGVRYGCFVPNIASIINSSIIERTDGISDEVLQQTIIELNSLFDTKSAEIDDKLSPYIQGAEGEAYQSIFSQMLEVVNTDDLVDTYTALVGAATNEEAIHNFSDGTLIITIK